MSNQYEYFRYGFDEVPKWADGRVVALKGGLKYETVLMPDGTQIRKYLPLNTKRKPLTEGTLLVRFGDIVVKDQNNEIFGFHPGSRFSWSVAKRIGIGAAYKLYVMCRRLMYG